MIKLALQGRTNGKGKNLLLEVNRVLNFDLFSLKHLISMLKTPGNSRVKRLKHAIHIVTKETVQQRSFSGRK